MQQELIEMLEKVVDHVVFCNGYDQRFTSTSYGVKILEEAGELVEKAKNCAKEPAVPDTHISVQEAWEAAGGNPGIKASKADLIIALKTLDTVCDEADAAPAVPQGFKPVGYLRSDEFDGHTFEPINGEWPLGELLFSATPAPEQEPVTLTEAEIISVKKASKASDPTKPWGDSIAFAEDIIAALRAKENKL